MPAKSPKSTESTLATTKSGTTKSTKSPESGITKLPENISFTLPDFSNLAPTDPFKPSSSSVPRTNDSQFREESKAAREQGNSIELLRLNLQNMESVGKAAVMATNVAKTMIDYQIGLEGIKGLTVRLNNARALTQNETIKLNQTLETGNHLSVQLEGAKLKTQIEGLKNQATQLELDYQTQLIPVKQTEWANKLEEARQRAESALNGRF